MFILTVLQSPSITNPHPRNGLITRQIKIATVGQLLPSSSFMMRGFNKLFWSLIVINANFGRPQSTCLYQGGDTVSGLCGYGVACFDPQLFTSLPATLSDYISPTEPCPQPEYTCSTLNTIAEPSITGYVVSCSSAVAPPVTSTLASPTSSTPSLPESTISSTLSQISSTSSQTTPLSQKQSKTSNSDITLSSSAIISSPSTTSTGITILAAATGSTTYPTLPSYTGGDLLRSYCATPQYTLLPGPASTIVIYVPFIGCVNDKPDCCPFAVSTNSSSTSTAIVTSTTTSMTVLSSSSSGASSSISNNSPPTSTALLQPTSSFSSQSSTVSTRDLFPAAAVQVQQTLKACPQDYHLVSSSCCPA